MQEGIHAITPRSQSPLHALSRATSPLQASPPSGLAHDQQFNSETMTTSPARALAAPPSGGWRPPSTAELRDALSKADSLFAKHLATSPEADEWLDSLRQCLEEKKLTPDQQGVEFYIRFKAAYSDIHHLGYGTMWRENTDEQKLKVAFMHQESVPPTPETKTVTGKFSKTFDTSALLKAKAPVDISMDLVGMPDMNVYPAEEPHQLEGITTFLDHPDTLHPYGLFQGYGPRLEAEPDIQHINCFAATEMASNTVHGGVFEFPNEDPVPGCIDRLGKFTCTDVRKTFDEISVNGKNRKLDDIAKFDPKEKIGLAMAAHVGRFWGEDMKWDVPGRLTLKGSKGTIKPGDKLALPSDTFAIKIMSRTPGLTLDGKPLARQPYTAQQVATMKYEGSEPLEIKFLYSIRASKL